MSKLPRFVRLAFVLFIAAMVVICAFLLFPDYFIIDRRLHMIRKQQISMAKGNQEADKSSFEFEKWASRRKQFAKIAVYNAHLLAKGFTDEQIRKMSSLGKWLLAPEGSSSPWSNTSNRNYLILIWKYGTFLERRHIRRFTSNKFSPWDQCSVQNCMLSYDEKDLHRADAVVFHLHFTKTPSELPKRSRQDQRWIFLTDESPFHTFIKQQKLSDYNGLFNWSMSYRMDSDVPVPYGRTIRVSNKGISSNNSEHWEIAVKTSKSKLVAIMASNCGARNGRWSYVKALKLSLNHDLDIFGRCLNGNKTVCPGHFDRDCTALKAYKFYLSFENSNCREYLTEKVFWNAYNKFAVPIIMGASREDCRRLLPPHSFLHVDDFANADTLAKYLKYLDRDDERYLQYHNWRYHYQVFNEHGFFGSISKHYCRICEALHYNSIAPKVYKKLDQFWNQQRDCTPT